MANARTRKEQARYEQERNLAFRQGIGAMQTGKPLSGNPYLNDPTRRHQAEAWERGWKSERSIRSLNARLKEGQ